MLENFLIDFYRGFGFLLWTINMVTVVSATWLVREDRTCDPARSNILFPYTGFRIQRQYTYGLPLLHHVHLSHCHHGKVDMESYLATNRNTDILWATNMCVDTDSGWCYRLVRKKQYANRNMSIFLPETQVGGIFMCPRESDCTNENSRPILPLMADRVTASYFELLKFRRLVKRTPYLYTPNYLDLRYPYRPDVSNDWASDLDVNENYTYTSLDKVKHLGSSIVNNAINAVHEKVSVDPKFIPWEHDRLDYTHT